MGRYHHIDTLSHPLLAPGSRKVRGKKCQQHPVFDQNQSLHSRYFVSEYHNCAQKQETFA